MITSITVFILLTGLEIRNGYRSAARPLGGVTYALYLAHQNIGYVATTALLDHIHTIAAIVSIALVAFSVLFHLLIEQNLNTAIKRFLLGAPVRWPCVAEGGNREAACPPEIPQQHAFASSPKRTADGLFLREQKAEKSFIQ